jgi:hypothetical protein
MDMLLPGNGICGHGNYTGGIGWSSARRFLGLRRYLMSGVSMRPTCAADVTEYRIIAALGETFYRVVPPAFTICCVHVSRVAVGVLAAFDVPARLVPCQLWHTTPTNNHVMGFVGVRPSPDQWDGHVACATDRNIFDAAVHGLRLKAGKPLPAIAGAPLFEVSTRVIARLALDAERQLWWYEAPEGADLCIPPASEHIVREHVAALVPLVGDRLVSGPPVKRLAG